MSEVVNVHDAKSGLSRLLRQVEAGQDVVIARNGRPVARLVRFEATTRRLGLMAGEFEVPDDLDAPLPDEVLDTFEGHA